MNKVVNKFFLQRFIWKELVENQTTSKLTVHILTFVSYKQNIQLYLAYCSYKHCQYPEHKLPSQCLKRQFCLILLSETKIDNFVWIMYWCDWKYLHFIWCCIIFQWASGIGNKLHFNPNSWEQNFLFTSREIQFIGKW